MRNQEVLDLLKKAGLPQTPDGFPSQGVIANMVALRNLLETLEALPGFEEEIDYFRSSIIYRSSAARVEVPPDEWRNLAKRYAELAPKLRGLFQYLSTLVEQQDQQAVFVKLPDTKDFAEIVRLQDTLNRALSQLVTNPAIGGKVEINGWERGSLWLEVSAGSMAAVAVIGTATWAAVVISKKVQEVRIFDQHVKSLSIKNENLSELQSANERLIKELVEKEAKAIADESFNGEADSEQIERIKYSIRELSELINKGAEIHPALQAPEKVANLFPKMTNLLAVNSRVKELTEKA